MPHCPQATSRKVPLALAGPQKDLKQPHGGRPTADGHEVRQGAAGCPRAGGCDCSHAALPYPHNHYRQSFALVLPSLALAFAPAFKALPPPVARYYRLSCLLLALQSNRGSRRPLDPGLPSRTIANGESLVRDRFLPFLLSPPSLPQSLLVGT